MKRSISDIVQELYDNKNPNSSQNSIIKMFLREVDVAILCVLKLKDKENVNEEVVKEVLRDIYTTTRNNFLELFKEKYYGAKVEIKNLQADDKNNRMLQKIRFQVHKEVLKREGKIYKFTPIVKELIEQCRVVVYADLMLSFGNKNHIKVSDIQESVDRLYHTVKFNRRTFIEEEKSENNKP